MPYLKYPETVQRLAMSYAIFTPDDWIKRPGYLLYIRIKGILSLTMTVVLLSIGIRNLLN